MPSDAPTSPPGKERAPAHAASTDYHAEALATDPERLSEVIRFDLPRLGPVAGLDVVHLQCHIGTDTVSLAKLGARGDGPGLLACRADGGEEVGGAGRPGGALRGVRALRSPGALGTTYDLVYTGVGALGRG